MAHVWNVIDGDIYVSKNGDDVTGDGSMASPYASLNKGFLELANSGGGKIVIGTGKWQEGISTYPNNLVVEGDGTVILDGGEVAKFRIIFNNAALLFTVQFINIVVTNYYDNIGGVIVWKFLVGSTFEFIKCYTEKAGIVNYYTSGYDYNAAMRWRNCIINNFTLLNNVLRGDIRNSNVINPTPSPGASFENSIISDTGYSIVGSSMFCCFYNYTGAIGGVNNIFLNPNFNNPEIGDYTLQPNSPCLFAGKNNSTIGAFGLGYSFDANSSEFTEAGGAVFSQTTLENDIIRTQQTINGITRFLFQLNTGHASGNVESTWIDLQTIRYLLITRLFANIIYNASGVATSRPDNLETAGEKAVYYDFELKYCNEESEKAAATFKNVIWNKAVTIDNSDRGNANPAFVASEAKYISARFVKIKLYMTEA